MHGLRCLKLWDSDNSLAERWSNRHEADLFLNKMDGLILDCLEFESLMAVVFMGLGVYDTKLCCNLICLLLAIMELMCLNRSYDFMTQNIGIDSALDQLS